jgi:hypothetical protein
MAAGHYDAQGDMSAMGRSGHKMVREIFYGFDEERFFLRIDLPPDTPPPELMKGDGLRVVFVHPRRRFIRVQQQNGGLKAQVVDPEGVGESKPAVAAAVTIIEVSSTFADLGFQKGDGVEFFVEAGIASGQRIRFPASAALRFTVPTEDFAKINWHV